MQQALNQNTIFARTKTLVQLRRIKQNNLNYLIQPLIDLQTNRRIEQAINHENGEVNCVTSLNNLKGLSELNCRGCNRRINIKDYYYDLTLDMILKQISYNQEYDTIQSIKFFSTGDYELSQLPYEEAQQIEELDSNQIVAVINQAGNQILKAYFSAQLPEFTQLKINSAHNEELLQLLCQKIQLNPINYKDLDPVLVVRANYVKPLEYIEILFLKSFKVMQFQICVQNENPRLKDFPKAAIWQPFIEDSRVYQDSLENIFIIGDVKIKGVNENCEGVKNVYVAKFQNYLETFASDKDEPYLRFQKLPITLNNPRIGFHLLVWEDYLYVIGGWKRGDKNKIDYRDREGVDDVYYLTDTGFINTNSDNLISMTVRKIERIKLDDLRNGKGKFEEYDELQYGLRDFGCYMIDGTIVMVGGAEIKYQSTQVMHKPFLKTQMFNVKQRKQKIIDNIFNDNQCNLMCGISFTNSEVAFYGGNGNFQPTRYRPQQNKLFIVDARKCKLNQELKPFEAKQLESMIPQYDYINPSFTQQIGDYFNSKYNKKFKFLLKNHWNQYEAPKSFGTFGLFGVDEQHQVTLLN